MKVTRAYDIVWETDGEDVNLPTEVELPRDFGDDDDAINNYLSAIKRVNQYLDDPEVDDIAIWNLESYLISLRDKGVSESTRQYYWKVMKSYFGWASSRKGLRITDPAEDLQMPTVPEPDVQPYTEREIKSLLKACKLSEEAETKNRTSYQFERPTAVRDQLIILILLDTGT